MAAEITADPPRAVTALPALARGGAGRPVSVLLSLAAVYYVITPVLQGAAQPVVVAAFDLRPGQVAVMKVAGAAATVLTMFGTGQAGDRWGRRRVLLWSLAALAAGLAVQTAAFSGWSYLLGRGVITVAAAALFVSCLMLVPALNAPGRMTRVLGGWLAVMSAAFFVSANLIPRTPSLFSLRAAAGIGCLIALVLLASARRRLPEPVGSPAGTWDRVLTTALAGVAATAVAALQVAPVWGWADPRTVALFAAVPLGLTVLGWRLVRRGLPFAMPARAAWMALATGVAVGCTQLALMAAVPVLAVQAGATPAQGTLLLSMFGLGGAAGSVLVRHRRIAPVAGCSLGLPLAALGLVLLHVLPAGTDAWLAAGSLATALTGLGVMIAQVPQMAWFLSSLPRARLGAAALHPVAVLLGAAAAQALPYTSAISLGAAPGDATQLLWVAVGVVAAAALVAGIPAVAVGVAAAAGGEYLLVRVIAGEQAAQRPAALAAALAVGAVTGLAVWTRRQQSERLARSRASEAALQQAVLHTIPERLGGLRLAGH
ncbi:MFS transporter [Kitasatospora sp. NPDC049285]|uniref:MFS transporter n=1 Tax=Kitasatospora sp. NPDC049285 TaxID=3157096 RepID=UPI0034482D05